MKSTLNTCTQFKMYESTHPLTSPATPPRRPGPGMPTPCWLCTSPFLAPHQYTVQYDAIVQAIREHADPEHKIKFVGLALSDAALFSWYQYFLNPANHAPGIPLDFISYHFCTPPQSRQPGLA